MSELSLDMEVFFRFSTVKKEQAHELIIQGRNKLIGSLLYVPMSPHGRNMGTYKRFWHSRPPPGRPTRRAISSVVERPPDNCVVVPGL
ncbi:hypothetical protein KSP40_PGU004926 [Platanthera guangdongensis]|uniref:Uncharacterized protein n=1 Tax=Platanthera guangdongensis TaxID=2320717 RepID=A0ABR2MXZ7_9ASPA